MVLELTGGCHPDSQVFDAAFLFCGINSLNPKPQTDKMVI